MINFTYYTPTKVVFGRETETQAGALCKEQNATKVLLVSGEESARRSGLMDRVEASLKEAGIPFVGLSGVQPNPLLSLVREGVDLCKAEKVDFLLAVGGGSVIDTAKAIGYGAAADIDVWDFFDKKAEPKDSLPVGVVVTIAAAGSEMSNSSVITNAEEKLKKGLNNDLARPRFAIMNPELTLTLPPYQTAVGCADILMHTIERYFTPEAPMALTLALAEGLLRTVMEAGRVLTRRPDDYDARANLLWASSLSHNDLTGAGGGHGDFACHQLSHALSAKYGLAHGAALTAVWSHWARYVHKTNVGRFARFALNVTEIDPEQGGEEALALAGIEEMEEFFWALELPTSLSEAGIEASDEDIADLVRLATYNGTRSIGAFQVLEAKDIEAIFLASK